MHDSKNLNRPALPDVADNVGVEVPKAIAAVREFLVIVTDSFVLQARTFTQPKRQPEYKWVG
jgi:hypothetical protein